jgi:flagellar biosynthesis GTPase FlhF
MFGRLFGKKKKKIDPEEQARLDKLKKEKKQVESKEKLEKTIAQNEKKIADMEAKNAAQYKEALAAKKAGNKEKAMRLLTNIKNGKAQIKKYTGYNTMMMKRINDMESMNTDIQMADIFKDTVGSIVML